MVGEREKVGSVGEKGCDVLFFSDLGFIPFFFVSTDRDNVSTDREVH
jgi:hypothetical protein